MKPVDANVLLYAINSDAERHEESRAWLDRALSGGATVALAWIDLLAFARLSTKVDRFPSPLSVDGALDRIEAWLASPAAVVVAPGPDHLRVVRSLLAPLWAGGNLVNDAHLPPSPTLGPCRAGRVGAFSCDNRNMARALRAALMAGVLTAVGVAASCSDSYVEVDRTAADLVCRGGRTMDAEYDFADGLDGGFATIDEVAEHWWSEDDGSLRSDRNELVAASRTDVDLAAPFANVDGLVVYTDGSDRPQLALLLDEIETGWRVVGYEACR